jgi:hypothetical protein
MTETLRRQLDKKMTLETYDPDRLDALSLRLLDVCARLRDLARISRQEQLPVKLHDRKALEWLDKLEDWAYGAEAEVRRAVLKERAARTARAARGKARSQDRSR